MGSLTALMNLIERHRAARGSTGRRSKAWRAEGEPRWSLSSRHLRQPPCHFARKIRAEIPPSVAFPRVVMHYGSTRVGPSCGHRGSHHVEIVVTGTERSSEKCKRRWSFLAFQRLYLDPGGVNFDRSRAVQPKPRKPGQGLRPPGPPCCQRVIRGWCSRQLGVSAPRLSGTSRAAAAPPSCLGEGAGAGTSRDRIEWRSPTSSSDAKARTAGFAHHQAPELPLFAPQKRLRQRSAPSLPSTDLEVLMRIVGRGRSATAGGTRFRT